AVVAPERELWVEVHVLVVDPSEGPVLRVLAQLVVRLVRVVRQRRTAAAVPGSRTTVCRDALPQDVRLYRLGIQALVDPRLVGLLVPRVVATRQRELRGLVDVLVVDPGER